MDKFIKSVNRKAIKNHTCVVCNIDIPKGVMYVVTSEVYEGKMMSSKWHTECRENFNEMLIKYGDYEGNPTDTYEDGVPEHIVNKYKIK